VRAEAHRRVNSASHQQIDFHCASPISRQMTAE
jgi:hypothetical protein